MEPVLPVGLLLLLSLLLVPVALLARRRRGRQAPPLRLLVVAGSDGTRVSPRLSVTTLAGTDPRSFQHRVIAGSSGQGFAKFTLDRIPRSREVRQSWTSSVATTLYSFLYSLPLTYKLKPDLILCNGPGTCVPVCVSALLLGLLGIKRAIIVYVESICRVETLSLSGKILYYFSDYFIVQWPGLKEKYPKSVYLGRIV
ncbi:UDP-N-acetylglucosamine transferase subunit ALG14 homolog isoform X4 [Colius striatus]|uniref:UDP-N-acetylglucosamine transferase subunit ALG14 homolog isoform X4 n=1 Tax=Colius striatus TaxID=57412 RepID=UPI002B1DB8BE|nr:UDP-N-acetylglucosamine transferase subunit ALG14 homolog isoform X4 [Colius striatus]